MQRLRLPTIMAPESFGSHQGVSKWPGSERLESCFNHEGNSMDRRPHIFLFSVHKDAMDAAVRAFASDWPDARVSNLLDDSLFAWVREAGGVVPEMYDVFRNLTRHMIERGADGILFTCSAFRQVIDACIRHSVTIPARLAFRTAVGPPLCTMTAAPRRDISLLILPLPFQIACARSRLPDGVPG